MLPYFSWWQIVSWLIPSTRGDSTDDPPWLVSLCVRRSEVHDFRGFLGYVLTDGYSWSVGFVSCVRYLCLLISPTPNCTTREFREFIGGNSSSYLGLSFQQMHEGLCICFWLILQANPVFWFELWYSSCFEVKCWSITFVNGVLMFLWEC